MVREEAQVHQVEARPECNDEQGDTNKPGQAIPGGSVDTGRRTKLDRFGFSHDYARALSAR